MTPEQATLYAMEVRHHGDYGTADSVSQEDAAEQVAKAKRFVELGDERLR